MTMESLAELLEQELEETVEIKNKKSLHRFITILTENLVRQDRNEREHAEFRENFMRLESRMDVTLTEMREGFRRMDERFEAVDKRFESVDKRFEAVDKRFESMERQFNRRFSMMFTFMTIGFVALATLMSLYQFLT